MLSLIPSTARNAPPPLPPICPFVSFAATGLAHAPVVEITERNPIPHQRSSAFICGSNLSATTKHRLVPNILPIVHPLKLNLPHRLVRPPLRLGDRLPQRRHRQHPPAIG